MRRFEPSIAVRIVRAGTLFTMFCVAAIASNACWGDAPISVLFISRANLWHGYLSQDPAVSVFRIPVPGHSHIELLGEDPTVLHRIMRIYTPRRTADLVGKYNMIILHECPYASTAYEDLWFKDTWVMMFVESIEEFGVSLEMWGGDAAWGGGGEGFYTSWGETMLGPLLPADGLGGYNYEVATPQRVDFVDESNALARLPWKTCPPIELNNAVKVKEGAHRVADVVHGGTRWPYIFDWEYGEGFLVGETQVVHSRDTRNLMIGYWDYFPDFVTYLVYYGARREIPLDVVLVKRLRDQISTHYAERSLVISVLDFAERFGANVLSGFREIDDIDQAHREAEESYLEGDYVECGIILDEIQQMWKKTSRIAVNLKDRALLWVYVIEYLVVSGAALACGVAVWSLMIRRRLYREVSTTKMIAEI